MAPDYNNCEAAFPRLTEAEMQMVALLGTVRDFADGEVLFREGDKDFPFYVVKAGRIRIMESSTGQERLVVEHEPGGFSGDIDLLTARSAVVTGRAAGGLQAIVVPAARMRRVLNEVPTLSDKLLQAFQLRRELLERAGFIGVKLLDRSDSPRAFRIQEFFYKNRVPFKFYDVDQDDGRALARERSIDLGKLPAIISRQKIVQEPSLAGIAQCIGISRDVPAELLDLVIVGAGPSGLAAAVYGGS